MKTILRPNHKERGQSMIELAIVITVLMVLLAGTIDLGRAFFTWLALRDAAQEGATYGSVDPTASMAMIETRVRTTFSDVVNDLSADIFVSINVDGSRCLGYIPADPSLNKPNSITVDITYRNFPLTMPFLGTLLGSQTIPIHAAITDNIISPVCP